MCVRGWTSHMILTIFFCKTCSLSICTDAAVPHTWIQKDIWGNINALYRFNNVSLSNDLRAFMIIPILFETFLEMWLICSAQDSLLSINTPSTCYLGDMLSAGGGCMAAATGRCRCAWGKFRENLPLLTSKPVPFDLRGRLFSSNVRSSMLHGTETWPMTSAALHRLCRNDRAMIRWICGVKPSDDPSMDELHAKLGICDLAILVRERRLRWFGHVMRSNGEINRVRSIFCEKQSTGAYPV